MSAEPARAYFGIGDVIAQLRPEFPDVSVSKIRFLEAEGLIQPARSPSGYRKFAPADVARLRYILTAQRDMYLPLRVIKNHLEAAGEPEGGEPPAAAARGIAGHEVRGLAPAGEGRFAGGLPPAGAATLPRRELLERTGIGEAQLAELEAFGLVRRTGRGYPAAAVAAVSAITALGGYGVQARHLRVVHAAAERETALIEQVVAPLLRQRSPGARERASAAAREIASLALQAHAALVEMILADAGFGERAPGTSER
jgi:DNA-binding transcriptional MerR regulator